MPFFGRVALSMLFSIKNCTCMQILVTSSKNADMLLIPPVRNWTICEYRTTHTYCTICEPFEDWCAIPCRTVFSPIGLYTRDVRQVSDSTMLRIFSCKIVTHNFSRQIWLIRSSRQSVRQSNHASASQKLTKIRLE